MSKDKKPTHEQALKDLEAAKAKKKAAWDAREAFSKEKGLPPKKDHSEHKDHGKAFSKLNKAWKDAKEELEGFEAIEKELRPKKERASKYEYPADCVTADDKKKFRAKQRAKANKEAKGEGEEGKKKKDKGEKAEKADKSDKKDKKGAEEVSKPKKKKESKED